MKVLITGATGFLGSHLCDLLNSKNIEIYCLARDKKKMQEFKIPGIFIQGELDTEKNKWIDELPEDLDTVIHTAGIVHSFEKEDFYKVNTLGTKCLLKDLKKRFSQLNFIFISSLSAAGPSPKNPLEEKEREKPVSHYGFSKLEAEKYLKKQMPQNWSLSIIRPPMIIGPRDKGVLDVFKMVKSGLVLNAGLSRRPKLYSFICVHDLTNFIFILLQKRDIHREVYFISNEKIITYRELIQGIKKVSRQKILFTLPVPLSFVKGLANVLSWGHKKFSLDFRLTPDKVSEVAPDGWTCSSNKIKKKFNLEFSKPLEKTLEETYADYKTRDWI
ncbi:MAG: NAD-dependent epimerase/dehydratase family protein [Bdellovibrionota bacterium]|nr:NAD-dependent epimerase/dehydratase family protein [Bdellovibrionota bacterium]